MMTCWVTVQLIKRLKLAPESTYIKVSLNAASQGGTTANLFAGDELSVLDCLHALMLPSGNDAATALAEHFGELLFYESKECQRHLEMQSTSC